MKRHHGWGFLIEWIILFCDLIVMNGVFFVVYYWMEPSDVSFFSPKLKTVILLLNFCYLFTLYFVPILIHKPIVHADKVVRRALTVISLHLILFITSLSFLYKAIFSVQFVVTYYIILYVVFISWRILARKVLTSYRKIGRNFKRIVIVGAEKGGLELYKELNNEKASGYKFLGFIDDNQSLETSLEQLFLGKISEMETLIVENKIDEIYCALPDSQHDTIVKIMNFCEKNMLQFHLIPEYSNYIKKSLMLDSIGSVPILSVRPEPLQYLHNRLLKRILDVVFSLFILLTVFPILYVIVALLIKL